MSFFTFFIVPSFIGLILLFLLEAPNVHEKVPSVDVSSGPSTHEKKTRHKRVAIELESAPKMKKLRVNADSDALYTKYILHKQKIKKPKEGET